MIRDQKVRWPGDRRRKLFERHPILTLISGISVRVRLPSKSKLKSLFRICSSSCTNIFRNVTFSFTTGRTASQVSQPPAHRWVRSASTTSGNRINATVLQRNTTAAEFTVVDERLTRTIRDIIRQRSREERAADAKCRNNKRKNDEKVCLDDVQLHSSVAARRSMVETVAVVEDADTRAHLAGNRFQLRARPTAPDRVSMTPQVSVVNGQIVINEKSLTVSAASERAAALNEFKRVEENGTKLNSSSYANFTKAEKWTNEDTEFFFQALKQFGTDFSLIQRLFPGRTRRQIKKKYLIEDRMNPKRVESAINHLSPRPDMYHRLIDVLMAPKTRNVQKGFARSILEPRNLESSCEGIVDNQ